MFRLDDLPAVPARYNIAPSEPILTIRNSGTRREASFARWGLVLTSAANGVVKPIHARMPLIHDPASYDRWLDPSPKDAVDLLAGVKGVPAEALEAYAVSPLVNRAGVEDPHCLDPVAR